MVNLVDEAGRALRYWHDVDSVVGDIVTIRGTVAQPDGTVLRVLSESLRFLDLAILNAFLDKAGFDIDAQYGDWDRGQRIQASLN